MMTDSSVGARSFFVRPKMQDQFLFAAVSSPGVDKQERITILEYTAASCIKFCIYFEKKGIMKALPDQSGKNIFSFGCSGQQRHRGRLR